MSVRPQHDGLLLPGLDGTNPLGFLAALGVLRVLSSREHGVKLSWHRSSGTWRPALYGYSARLAALGSEVHLAIHTLDKSVWSIDTELPFLASRLRGHALDAVASSGRANRLKADSIAALGAECCRAKKNVKNTEIEIFKDTYFRLVRSGDNHRNGLLSYAARTFEACSAEHIQRAVGSDWRYRDAKLSFRWDPAEDRGYALQWGDPSDDGALTERGANCLGLFGLAYFPVIPVRGQAETTGFGLKARKQSAFTWPIWNHPISPDVIRSLLTLSALQSEQPDSQELNARGVVAAFRCNRVMTTTYYANFTPSQRVA